MAIRSRTNQRSRRRSRAIGAVADDEYNPLTAITWHSAFWASDPLWSNPADGAAVSTWRSGGTNTVALTQATEANQPLYRAAYANLNGRPAVDFDGSNDALVSTFGATQFSPFSVVAIVHWDTVGGTQTAVLGGSSSVNYVSTSNTAWRIRSTTNVTGGVCSTGKHLHRVLLDVGAADDLEVDGTMVLTNVTAGDTGISAFVLGQPANLATDAFNGAIAFVGVFLGDISGEASWAAFKTWASTYYSLTLA